MCEASIVSNKQEIRNLPSTGGIILSMASLAAAVWLLYTFRGVVAPLVIAALLAYLLSPLVAVIVRLTKWDRNLVVFIVYFIMVAGLVALFVLYLPVVIAQAKYISLEFYRLISKLDSVKVELEGSFGIYSPYGMQEITGFIEQEAALLFHPEQMYRLVSAVSNNAIWVLVVFVASYYFLKDGANLYTWLFEYVPPRYQADAGRLLLEIKNIWQSYLRGQLVVMLVVGVLSGLSAWVLGLRGALFLGFLAGTLDIIPSVGPAVATGVAAFAAWTLGTNVLPISNEWFMIVVVVIFTTIQLIENILLVPQVMKHHLKLHPGLVFVMVVSSLAFVGVLMALIIVPLLASIFVILRYLQKGMRDDEVLVPEKVLS
jgi:predicted PurR-regulated permease PerM